MNCSTDKITLNIESQAFGGYGVGRHLGKVIFVPDTIKGDIVSVELVEEKKSFAYAKLLEILSPSTLRIDPKCEYNASCGGCQWLSLPHQEQILLKESFLNDALFRIAKITLSAAPNVHFAKTEYYRNRASFRGTIHEDGSLHVGFMERASHLQIPIQHCRNVDPRINAFLKELYQVKTSAKPQKFRLEIQVLPASQLKNEAYLLIVLHPLHGDKLLQALADDLRHLTHVEWVGMSSELNKADHFLFEEDLGCSFYTAPGAFQQVNIELNHKARRLAKNFCDTNKIRSVMDLFCGSGNLSLALAKTCEVFGIEQSRHSIAIAQTNINKNKLEKARYVCAPAERILNEKANTGEKFDLLIADPPRAGMKECIPAIKRLKPQFICYMSCDPMTLARDIKELSPHYSLIETHVFDFFPNTFHLESMIFLGRKL